MGKNSHTSLYSETTKCEYIFDKTKTVKKANMTKRVILNSLSSKLQLKNTEPVLRNKLKDLLTKLIGFKLLAILDLEFKK